MQIEKFALTMQKMSHRLTVKFSTAKNYCTLLCIYVTVLPKTCLVCTSDFGNLKDHKMLLDSSDETFSNDEGIFNLQTLQILTCVAPKEYYEPLN